MKSSSDFAAPAPFFPSRCVFGTFAAYGQSAKTGGADLRNGFQARGANALGGQGGLHLLDEGGGGGRLREELREHVEDGGRRESERIPAEPGGRRTKLASSDLHFAARRCNPGCHSVRVFPQEATFALRSNTGKEYDKRS